MRTTVVVIALCVSVLALADSPSAAASIRKPTNIAAQELATALRALEKDRNLQVIFVSEDVRDLHTQGAIGEFTADEALKQLLKGTGLTFRYLDEKTVTIVPVSSATPTDKAEAGAATPDVPSPPATGEPRVSADRFRIAQADQGAPQEVPLVNKRDDRESKKRKADELEEVVVIGSRIPRTAKEGAQELRIYTQEQIDATGQTTVADFLNTLPEVSMASIDSAAGNYADQTTVQLHGLPIGTTLVLLNGRRVEINNYGFFDLNSIPISAVERIEVLPVGSSAIYGADSLAGAVNIVLKKEFGFEVSATHGHASDTDETDAALSWGEKWARADFSIMGSYQERGALLGSERGPTSNPNGGLPAYGLVGDNCNPGTIYSTNGHNLPGLSSPEAAIPPRLSGTPTVQDFVATAGKVHACNDNDSLDFISPSNRQGLLASGHYKVSEALDLFSEVLYSHEIVKSAVGNVLNEFAAFGDVLPASNAYNPFGQTIGISYTYSGLPSDYDRTTTFVRPLVGARGLLWGAWNYEVTAFISGDRSQVSESGPNFNAISAALASSNPTTALNLFDGGAPGSPQLLASLVQPSLTKFTSQTVVGQGLLRGTLVTLPSGPVGAVFGTEYDRSKISTSQTDIGVLSTPFTATRDAYAFFTEERIPIFVNREHAENGEKLALSVAGRFDGSNDFGSKTTGQSGIEWRPTESLLVRGGYAMSYEAPQLPQLSGSTASFSFSGAVDPFRGNQPVVGIPVTSGPNPNLRPETGQSRSLGVVYSSKTLLGLEASLNYWGIDIGNYIGTPAIQDLISHPNLFPGAIARGTPSQSDIQNGYPGPITGIQDIFFNFGTLTVAGLDWDVRYSQRTEFGVITPSVSATETYKYNASLSPSLPPTSNLNQAGTSTGFAPRWKITAAINWKVGNYSAAGDGRYVGHYNDYLGYVGTYPHDIGNCWVYDANFRYAFGHALAHDNPWLAGAYLEVGGVNLLNRAPPRSYSFTGYDSAEFDLRGRFLYVQLGAKW